MDPLLPALLVRAFFLKNPDAGDCVPSRILGEGKPPKSGVMVAANPPIFRCRVLKGRGQPQ